MSTEPKSTAASLEKMQQVIDDTPGPHTISVDIDNDCSRIIDGTGKVTKFAGSTIGKAGDELPGARMLDDND
jgi:hypothetical protein